MLPARRVDALGREHVDLRAVVRLTLPLIATSGVQLMLNLTDLWFIGHISTTALAAFGAVNWLSIVVVMLFGGVAMAVQTVAAQAHGSRRRRRAAHAVWLALWGTLLVLPLYLAAGLSAGPLLAPFGLPADIRVQAEAFWFPRVAGAAFGTAVWSLSAFFNGIGRPRVTAVVTLVIAGSNALFNQLFIFGLGWGIAGSARATVVSQALGVLVSMVVFLSPHYARAYGSRLTWRPNVARLWRQLRLGLPMGLLAGADLLGMSIFLLMQARLGAVSAAASQLVMALTALAYMPGLGVALAGTTLVGQSIGAGSRRWARRLGNHTTAFAALYMGGIGLLLAAFGPQLLPLFAAVRDASGSAVIELGARLLWIAALYQLFDGLNLGSAFALRGAGDAVVPAVLVILLSWLLFLPLAHALMYSAGQGWYELLPQFGQGAIGGWWALVLYVQLLGLVLLARWRSAAWERSIS